MPPSLTDGVPGLEALHTLTPPSPFATFTLNDWMDPATGFTRQWDDQSAWTQLTGITGLHDKPDADDPRVNLVYQRGELPLPRLPRGRTITYTGLIVGQTLSAMRAQRAALEAACDAALNDPTAWLLGIAYDPTYDDSGLAFAAYGVPIAFTCDDTQPAATVLPSPWQREFVLTFRQSDGRYWVTPDAFLCSTGSADSPNDSGSPETLTLTGLKPSEPVFTIYGTGDGSATLILTGAEVSGQLKIVLPDAMDDGDTLVVDFGQRSVTFTHSGVAKDYSGYIDWANTNWWNESDVAASLLVGDNTLEVDGDAWSCTAVPAV